MPTYYVATTARYVLVDAADEANARVKGEAALQADYRERLGRDVPVEIRTVRLATDEEVELQSWHEGMVARERV